MASLPREAPCLSSSGSGCFTTEGLPQPGAVTREAQCELTALRGRAAAGAAAAAPLAEAASNSCIALDGVGPQLITAACSDPSALSWTLNANSALVDSASGRCLEHPPCAGPGCLGVRTQARLAQFLITEAALLLLVVALPGRQPHSCARAREAKRPLRPPRASACAAIVLAAAQLCPTSGLIGSNRKTSVLRLAVRAPGLVAAPHTAPALSAHQVWQCNSWIGQTWTLQGSQLVRAPRPLLRLRLPPHGLLTRASCGRWAVDGGGPFLLWCAYLPGPSTARRPPARPARCR